jgi:parallel beta-helix repeat protein
VSKVSDTVFDPLFPGPTSVMEDSFYFYDDIGRRIAYKGLRYRTAPLVGRRLYATINETIAQEQFDELGSISVLYVASFIKFYFEETNQLPEPEPGIFCVSTSTELAEALLASENDGEDNLIQLVQGLYEGNFVYNSGEMHDLTLEGGYIAGCGSRVVDPATTVLDGIGNGTVLNISSAQAINITVDGITLQNGSGGGILLCCDFNNVALINNLMQENTINDRGQGGGISICCDVVTVSLSNNTVNHNIISGQGGGVFVCCNFGTMTLDNNTINNNTTADQGGGLFVCCEADILSLNNNIIDGNTTTGQGGGLNICCTFGTINLNNNVVSSNTTSDQGGGLFVCCEVSNLSLSNNTVSSNATTDQGGGVFVCCDTVTVTLNNNLISNNLTSDQGGGVFVCCGPITQVTLLNNIISHNMAGVADSDEGGGVYISGGPTAVMINNVISSNTATNEGGGIFVSDVTTATIVNNTVQGNTSNNSGGGVFASLATGERIDIYNNIVWNNQAVQGADLYLNNDADADLMPATVNLFNNDFDQGAAGIFIQLPFPIDPSNLNNVDPLFVDAVNGNYHLLSGSPVIDKGDNNAPSIPATDHDENPRIINGVVDMGAFEFTP